MAACKSGRNLLCWVCVLLISSGSVESHNWTAQPWNPVETTEGQEVSLTWNYTLTADEQTASQTFFRVTWRKLNLGTSSFDEFASYLKITGINPTFGEPNAPRIVVDRSISTSSALLQFKDVRLEDEGIYKIEISVEIGDATIAEQEFNLTVVVPPGIANVSKDQVICEGSLVTLSCNATGKPTPNITWRKVEDIGTDGAALFPVVEGKHLLNNIQRSANGTYRCTADNGVGVPVNRTVSVKVEYSPAVERIVNSSNSVIEGQSFNMTCVTSGYPEPNVYWIEESNYVRINGSVLNFTNINRNDSGQYRCEAKNACGSNSSVQSIDVFYPPNITYISEGMTVNQSESVNLTCRADGNPKPSITWTKDGNITNSSFTVRGKSDEGLYVCTADNGIGNVSSKSVLIAVDYFGPFNTSHTTLTKIPNIVYLNTPFNLSCSAQAKPPASYRFYRGQESLGNISVGNTLEISVVERTNQVNYACIPFNQFGDGRAKIVPVEVYYSPQVTESDKTISVSLGNSATLTCPVDGNPPPSVEWYQRNVINVQTLRRGKTWEINNATLSDSGLYTCSASNPVGSVTATVILEVVSPTNSPQDNYKVRVKLVDSQFLPDYVNLNSQPAQELISAFVAEMNKLYKNYANYDRTEVTKLSNGTSVIVCFVVYFKTTVTENEGLAKLRDAVDNNKKLGNFTANALEVIQINPTTAASNERSTGNPSNSRQKDGPPWPIIGGIIGAVVAVIIVILLVAWWVHNKRKCRRKDTKIHNSESEGLHGQNDIEDGAYARVNGSYDGRYADSGPPSANGTNTFSQQPQPPPEQQQQLAAAAPPAYAVVDKSIKKKKKKAEAEDPYAEVEDPKKDKKTADPSTHDYAVVNKSKKKKKKEEDENAYATVDKSKKSKKGQQKPKAPGEVLYADLGDFQPVQPLPTVSTSPEPLAPLKRPTPYQGTEYADITQFLKGNATLPEGQSTEMQPTYANAGGGQEAANKENANKGGEGDTEPKETPM